MEFKNIVAISGKSGLFEIVGKRPDGIIVRHLDTNKKEFVSKHGFILSPLDKISIYTENNDSEMLLNIFLAMQADENSGGTLVSDKADKDALKKYLSKILPTYDQDRVYPSDIKKLVKWYTILKRFDLVHPVSETTNATTNE